MVLIEWIAVPLSLLGNFLVARKIIWGFVVWMFSNILWIYVGVTNGLWGMATLFTIYFFINIYAVYFWKKTKRH